MTFDESGDREEASLLDLAYEVYLATPGDWTGAGPCRPCVDAVVKFVLNAAALAVLNREPAVSWVGHARAIRKLGEPQG